MKDKMHNSPTQETENNFSLDTIKEAATALALFSAFLVKSVQDFAERNSDSLAQIGKAAILLANASARLDEGQKNMVIRCLESGWYPIWNMAFTYIPDDQDLDAIMAKYIESHMDSIEEILCGKYETRADILKAAFTAHKHGQYALSIPPFLAQAEGICREQLEISPFSQKNSKRLRDKIPPELYNGFILRYFQPVVLNKDIGAKFEDVHPAQLNRNTILHGISTEYATRINSLKAISYLSSLSFLLSMLEESKKQSR